ncbi:MAG: tryptophan-rich sensory protein [Candidatus Bathyarchaeota archaeon]
MRIANPIAFIATIIVNGLAGSTTLLGGQDTAAISDANFTLITPAGYVFAIWGIIYTLLGIFVIYQALPSQKGKEYQNKIGWLFVLSSIINIVWLFLWQYEYLIFSVPLMFMLLATLILIYTRLGIGISNPDLKEKIAIQLPFSTYLGWITIASIANVATTMVSISWEGFGISAENWASVIIIIALLLASIVIITRKDIAYTLVIAWAFVGISVAQTNQNIVMLTQISAVVVLILLTATILYKKLK